MKPETFKSIFIVCLIALLVYVTVTPIALYKAIHNDQIKRITYELVEPGSELETFILTNDTIGTPLESGLPLSIDYEQQ